MNEKPDNPKAFPCANADISMKYQGMTLRDYFAAKAMQAVVTSTMTPTGLQNGDHESVSKYAYQIADAMLKQREL